MFLICFFASRRGRDDAIFGGYCCKTSKIPSLNGVRGAENLNKIFRGLKRGSNGRMKISVKSNPLLEDASFKYILSSTQRIRAVYLKHSELNTSLNYSTYILLCNSRIEKWNRSACDYVRRGGFSVLLYCSGLQKALNNLLQA